MPKDTYERFGLTGNPFRDLASETIDLVDIFHVDQEFDEELKEILEEVAEKENKAIVAILGSLGVGKTQRLMLISNYARRKEYFHIFRTMTPETKWAIKGIMDAIIEEAPLTAMEKYVNAPRWFVEMKKVSKGIQKGKGHDPVKTGKLIAESLNRKSPSFLLINDLQAIPKTKELSDFMQTLYVVINNINPGVLVAVTSNKYFFDDLIKENEAFDQRINKKFYITPLTPKQAEHLIAKRLLARRLTDELGLVYPFTKESIKILNDEVMGNPRQILKVADSVMEKASKAKTVEIDQNYVIEHIKSSKGNEMLPPAPAGVETAMMMKGLQVKQKENIDPESLPGQDCAPVAIQLEEESKTEKKDLKSDIKKKEDSKNDDEEPSNKEIEPEKTEKVQDRIVEKEIEKTRLDLGIPEVPTSPKTSFLKEEK
jgi:hypothetical protein